MVQNKHSHPLLKATVKENKNSQRNISQAGQQACENRHLCKESHMTIPCHHMTMTLHHTITHTISPQDVLRMFSDIIDLGQGVVVKVNCTGTDNHMSILKLV